MRGNRRWVIVGSAFLSAGPIPQGAVHHWVPRGVPGKPTVTACGWTLPTSFSVWWGGTEPRCPDCARAREEASK